MDNLVVELIYLTGTQSWTKEMTLNIGNTVEQAIKQSGLLQENAELNMENLSVGIFGKKVTLNTQLQDQDRLEIYRPLIIDPKMRRLLLARNK